MGTELIIVGVVAALATAAYFLLQAKSSGSKSPLDNSRSTPSTRGTILRMVLGRLLVAPVIGYIGNRYTKNEPVEGSGGGGKGVGGGGEEEQKQTIYYESGMHILSMGQGRSIQHIYQGGKDILSSPIYASTSASGSTFTLSDKEGTFTVHWGETGQGVDSHLSGLTSLKTAYPHIFYVVWKPKRLGTQALWPNIEYDIEVDHPIGFTVPTDGDYIRSSSSSFTMASTVLYTTDLSSYTSLFDISATTPYIFRTSDSNAENLRLGDVVEVDALEYSSTVVNVFDSGSYYYICVAHAIPASSGDPASVKRLRVLRSGVNPASALKQMLFHNKPFGLELNTTLFHMDDFNTLSQMFATAVIPCTVALSSGQSFQDGIASIMQDFGLMMYFDTEDGKYGFTAIREGDSTTAITYSEYNGDELAQTFAYAVLDADKMIFVYKDSAKKFSDSSIMIVNDAGTRYSENPQSKKITLETVTDLATANAVVSRRQQEENVSESLTVNASPSLIHLRPGARCTLEGFTRPYRLVEKFIDPNSVAVELSFLQDSYSIDTDGYIEVDNPNVPASGSYSSVPDVIVKVFEPTRLMAPDSGFLMVGRVRYGSYINGANVYGSPDEVSYVLSGPCSYMIGGQLTADWDFTGALEEDGPEFTEVGHDLEDILNLTGQEEYWRSGGQCMLIGNEIIYLRNVDVETMTLKGLIRGRLGTVPADYTTGEQFLMFPLSVIEHFSWSFLNAGATIFIKTQPYSSYDVTSLDDVPAVEHDYMGGGYRPLPVTNLNTADLTLSFEAGEDIVFNWSYMKARDAGASGMGLAGEVSTAMTPEGEFYVEILNGSTVVRTETVFTNSYTYTDTDRLADFSSVEPSSFNIRVREMLGGLTSEYDSVTVEKVA